MMTLIAIAVAFVAGAYVGASNADIVKKAAAVALTAATGAAAYFEGFKGWLQ
jgi:hypothetical protein